MDILLTIRQLLHYIIHAWFDAAYTDQRQVERMHPCEQTVQCRLVGEP